MSARLPEGYTYGTGTSGEPARMEVCVHGQPLGWACVGCAPGPGTAPAHRAKPPIFVYRAVCNHCAVRSWVYPDA